jgi:hypothetical protein
MLFNKGLERGMIATHRPFNKLRFRFLHTGLLRDAEIQS